MERPRLLPRQFKTPDNARQTGRVQPLAESLLEPIAERWQGPLAVAVPLPVRAAKDGRRQHRLFGLGQSRWAAELGTISQALQAVGAT
jgi:hypothetical protein